jgi:hypothetical protein
MVYVCKKYLYNKKRSIARQDVKLARRKNYRELVPHFALGATWGKLITILSFAPCLP